jgi:hypothetical protein
MSVSPHARHLDMCAASEIRRDRLPASLDWFTAFSAIRVSPAPRSLLLEAHYSAHMGASFMTLDNMA